MKKKIFGVFAGIFFVFLGAAYSFSNENKPNNVPDTVKEAQGYIDFFLSSRFALWTLAFLVFVLIILLVMFMIIIAKDYNKPYEPGEIKRKVWFFEKERQPEIPSQVKTEEEPPTEKIEGASESSEIEAEDETIIEKQESGEVSDFFQAWNLIENGDFNKGYELFENSTETSGESKLSELSHLTRIGIKQGFDEALTKLKELADSNPNNLSIHLHYSRTFVQPENFERCHIELKNIYENADNENIKIVYLEAISKLLCSIEKFEEAFRFLKNEIKVINEIKNQSAVYQELGDLLFKWKGDNSEKGFFFWEIAKKLNPKNKTLIFDMALKYSKQNVELLSFYHYDDLINIDPKNSWGLNNKGVAASKLGLHFEKIKHYLKAVGENNTLASSNLARVLKKVGMYDQAKEILKKARDIDDYGKEVDITSGDLEREKEEENEKLKKILENGNKLSSFHSRFGQALGKENFEYERLAGEYTGTPCGLKLHIDNSGQLSGEVILPDDIDSSLTLKSLKLKGLSKNVEIEGEGSLLTIKWKPAGLGESLSRKSLMSSVSDKTEGGLIIQNSGTILEGYFSRNALFSDIEIFDWKLNRKEG